MTGGFEPVQAYQVNAKLLGRESVTDSNTLVYGEQSLGFKQRYELRGRRACCLDVFDALFDDDSSKAIVVGGSAHGWQNSQVHAPRFGGESLHFANPIASFGGRACVVNGKDAQSACV